MSRETKIMKNIEQILIKSDQTTIDLINKYYWKNNDIRISIFGKNTSILATAFISTVCLERHMCPKDADMRWWKDLSSEEWWTELYLKDNYKIAIEQSIHSFQLLTKFGLIIYMTANTDSAFRLLIKAISPEACKNGDDSFCNIYKHLLKKLNLKNDISIYEMLRHLRNAMLHTDGVFQPLNKNDARVEYRSKAYEFIVGKSPHTPWELVIDLANDLTDSLIRIVNHPDVLKIKEIIDPQKK